MIITMIYMLDDDSFHMQDKPLEQKTIKPKFRHPKLFFLKKVVRKA